MYFCLNIWNFFDSNNVERLVLNRVIQIMMDTAPIDIYILPGNHDPLTLDSPYWDPSWNSLSNVHILKRF